MTFIDKIKNKPTIKYESNEEKLQKALKSANRAKIGYKALFLLSLTGIVALGFMYRNLQVTTELNTLKHDIELRQQMEKALIGSQSNAHDPKE